VVLIFKYIDYPQWRLASTSFSLLNCSEDPRARQDRQGAAAEDGWPDKYVNASFTQLVRFAFTVHWRTYIKYKKIWSILYFFRILSLFISREKDELFMEGLKPGFNWTSIPWGEVKVVCPVCVSRELFHAKISSDY